MRGELSWEGWRHLHGPRISWVPVDTSPPGPVYHLTSGGICCRNYVVCSRVLLYTQISDHPTQSHISLTSILIIDDLHIDLSLSGSWVLRKSSQTNRECQVVPSDPSRPPCRCRLSEDIQIGGESSLLIRTCHSLSILINWTVSFKWSIMLLHLGGNVRTDRITNLISRSGQW